MTGKEKCQKLKVIRKNLADELGINLQQSECTYEGECKGTCPKCKREESILNSALVKKGAVVLGAAALSVSLAACNPLGGDVQGNMEPPQVEEPTDLSGEVEVQDPSGCDIDNPSNDGIQVEEPAELEGDVVVQE